MTQGNKPIKKFRAGAISAAVFQNEVTKDGKTNMYYSIVIDRTYKDRDDQWQRTNNFRFYDLPNLRYVSDKAYEFLVEMRNESKGIDNSQDQQQHPVEEEAVM